MIWIVPFHVQLHVVVGFGSELHPHALRDPFVDTGSVGFLAVPVENDDIALGHASVFETLQDAVQDCGIGTELGAANRADLDAVLPADNKAGRIV